MNTLSLIPTLTEVPAPTSGNAQWWPDLFLKKGRKLQAITLGQCEALATEYRNRAMADGRGASDTPAIRLYDGDGTFVARIAWNGRVFSSEGMEICE